MYNTKNEERNRLVYEMYISDRTVTLQEIADKFGLTRTNVGSIIHRYKARYGLLKPKK